MPKIQLSADVIKNLPIPEKGKVDYYDESITGFLCEARASGGKTFYLKYRSKHGALKQYKLGDVKDLSFDRARTAAQKLRARVVLGEDPVEDRKVLRATPTLAQFVEERYLPYAKATKKSWSCDETLLRLHILPRFGSSHMDEITTHAVTEHFHGKLAAGYAKGTCNRILVLFRYMFNLAKKWEIPGADKNPTAGIPLLDNPPTKERFLTQEEVQRLYLAVKSSQNPMLQYLVPFMILTGARKREVYDCRWDDISIERRSWRIPVTKAGRPRHVPLSEGLIRLLATIPRYPNCPYVFPNLTTMKPLKSGFTAWNTARKQAGLKDVRMHDLRHSFASFLVNAGRSLYEVQKLLGHTQVKTTQRYSHLAPETLLAATDAAACAAGLTYEGMATEVNEVPALAQVGDAVVIEVVEERLAA